MRIKTSEASGAVLDYMVAQSEGFKATIDGYGCIIMRHHVTDRFEPSTNWGWGGPIIEREGIELFRYEVPGKAVYKNPDADEADLVLDHVEPSQWSWMAGDKLVGPTPLVAAMRCFVASKLGEEVEVPDELCRT